MFALAVVMYIGPLIVNGINDQGHWQSHLFRLQCSLKSCLVTLKVGHMAYASASSHFGVSSFPALGRQTLSFINVASFHLTSVVDLKRKAIFLTFHSFCIYTSFLLTQKTPILRKMSYPSSTGSNSPNNDSDLSSIGNAPPMALNPIPPLPHFPIFFFPYSSSSHTWG